MKSRSGGLVTVAILLSFLPLLVGCRRTATQEVISAPTPTAHATLPAVTTATPARDPLNGTRWVILSLYGEPPLEGTRITLEFSGGFIRGFAGCNKYVAGSRSGMPRSGANTRQRRMAAWKPRELPTPCRLV
jgi:heat shock protein HslJ